LTFDFEQSL